MILVIILLIGNQVIATHNIIEKLNEKMNLLQLKKILKK